MINTERGNFEQVLYLSRNIMRKIGTEKSLANFRITQFLGCWENPNFLCGTISLLAISLKKRFYNYIAKSLREWKRA
jgi:hypothetical protein